MTPHDLLANFETLAEAPNGIQRLREMVLELAVRGKLVEQDPAEGMAQNQFPDLCIGRLQSDSPKRGRQLKGPDAPELAPDDLPGNSIWVPIGQLMDLHNGRAFKPNEWATTGLPIIRIQNLNDPSAPFNFCNFEVPEKVHVHDGDLLISWSGTPGTSFGAFIWTRGHAVLNQHIFRVELRHPKLVPEYIRLSVNARLDEMISRAHGGVGLRHITKGELEAIGIPIPPEAEQRRIVARVDELMVLLGRLEAKRLDREAARTAARDSALAALREAPTPDDVEAAWLRIQGRIGELVVSPADVVMLRESIHHLGTRGVLLPLPPVKDSDEPLLHQINSRKRELIKDGKLRPDSKAKPIVPDEEPFAVPTGWQWCRMRNLLGMVTSGSRSWKEHYADKGAAFIRSQDIKRDRLEYDERAYVNPPSGAEGTRTLVQDGDLLITITGANVGKCALISEDPGEAYVSQHVALLKLVEPKVGQWLHTWLTSEFSGRALLLGTSYGAKPGLNLDAIRNLLVPIPPEAHIELIITTLNRMSDLCDQLSTLCLASEAQSKEFAQAAIHHLDM